MQSFIGFDLDGVIIDHTASKIIAAGQRGIFLHPEDTPSGVIKKAISSEEIYESVENAIYYETRGYSLPFVGIRELLESIKRRKISYALISQRKEPKYAIDLLKRYDIWPRYFSEQNANFVVDIEEKNVIAEKLGVTHYIDDRTDVLARLVSVKNKFLFDPHNVWPDSDLYIRIRKIPDIKAFII